jgi:hypothetical protein
VFHSISADPEDPDCGADGTSVTEVPFLVPMALAVAIKLSALTFDPREITKSPAARSRASST